MLAEDVRHFEPGAGPRAQKLRRSRLDGSSSLGSRSSGLVVAHTVLVAIFR